MPMDDEPTSGSRPRKGASRQKKGKVFSLWGGGIAVAAKAYESPIVEIKNYTFNSGENKFATQFMESHERVANYLQQSGLKESHLVAETVQRGVAQTIKLPGPVDPNMADKADLKVIQTEMVKSVTKRQQKLEELLKKGFFATIYDQCSQEVCNKLRATKDCERVQRDQSLQELIG